MYKAKITKEEIALLPLVSFKGQILIVNNLPMAKLIARELSKEKVLGFDTETKPTFAKGKMNTVALLQLSTAHKAYIFQLKKIGLPHEVSELLSNPDILKIGAATADDVKNLRKLHHFHPAGFLDLQAFVKPLGIQTFSVKGLAAIVLNYRISKSKQLSNWEEENLSQAQIEYAATDAWICLEIYKKLVANLPVE